MSFTESLSRATQAIASTVSASDDDKGSDEATATANANKAAGDEAAADTRPKKAPAPPKDDTETATSSGNDIPTTDSKIAKATKLIGRGTQKVGELAARTQHRINNEARKGWGEKMADDAGLPEVKEPKGAAIAKAAAKDVMARRLGKSDAAGHAAHTAGEVVHGAHHADLLQATVRAAKTIGNYPTKEVVEIAIESKSVGILGAAGKVFEGAAPLAYGAGLAGAATKIVDNFESGKPAADYVEPGADAIVNGVGILAGGNIYVRAFNAGYTAGRVFDHYTGVSTGIANLAEPAIAQTTQIGFLTDRARETDLTVAHRTRTGTWTDGDLARSRSIVREAREHGILDEDGEVSRHRLKYLMPDGGNDEAVDRVAGGIERAVELQRTANSRYY